jgi:hypothetical protein
MGKVFKQIQDAQRRAAEQPSQAAPAGQRKRSSRPTRRPEPTA